MISEIPLNITDKNSSNKIAKMSFYTVLSLVVGSQIGSGILVLPTELAKFGSISLVGLTCSSIGAIFLALVFAELCKALPGNSGPHAYGESAFGKMTGFFIGWTYWLISWISSITVIASAIAYLSPFINEENIVLNFALEIGLLIFITWLNIKGVDLAGKAEAVLVILKVVPLIIIPIVGIYYFNAENFTVFINNNNSFIYNLNQSSFYTLWLFIGLECATTSANSVENPEKTIPKAVTIGTIIVAVLYLINSVGIMAILPLDHISNSKAPYVEAAKIIFGNNVEVGVAICAFIVCVGTLNAWVLTSGQIAYSTAKEKLLPPLFGKVNDDGAPYVALIISCVATIPFLYFTLQESLMQQINFIIDISVAAFLLIYAVCVIAFLKLLLKQIIVNNKTRYFIGIVALIFCIWALWFTPRHVLIMCTALVGSGLPVYYFQHCRKKSE